MVDFVVDKSLDVLLGQLNAHAPGRDKSSDGSIGDAAHQGRPSAHNPQDTEDSSDGNDPDNQVDARDFTHDPDSGADMHQMTEEIRLSRDRRVNLVIWNRRQFSSYSTSTRKAWAWGPYSGSNPHDKHAHVETNDLYNDDLTPWKVFQMADSKAVTSTEWRVWFTSQLQEAGKNPATGQIEKYPVSSLLKRVDAGVAEGVMSVKRVEDNVLHLVDAVDELRSMLQTLLDRAPVQPAPVDPEVLRPVVEDGVRAVLRTGVDG